jgi:hypothetical protein
VAANPGAEFAHALSAFPSPILGNVRQKTRREGIWPAAKPDYNSRYDESKIRRRPGRPRRNGQRPRPSGAPANPGDARGRRALRLPDDRRPRPRALDRLAAPLGALAGRPRRRTQGGEARLLSVARRRFSSCWRQIRR